MLEIWRVEVMDCGCWVVRRAVEVTIGVLVLLLVISVWIGWVIVQVVGR